VSVGKTRKRPRAEHLGPERRRPEVLDCALAIAARRGVRAVTMEAVAAELGVTKPVVYACYGSRGELVDALLEREEARLLGGVMAALPADVLLSDEAEMFRRGFLALIEVVAASPASWDLVFASTPDPSVARRYGRSRDKVSRRVAELMRIGLAKAGTEDLERKLPVLVDLFMFSGDTAVRAWRRDHTSWTKEDLAAFIGRVVLAALDAA
jgi:AcrR family transcriptional regulator